jgi:hypothetical protein
MIGHHGKINPLGAGSTDRGLLICFSLTYACVSLEFPQLLELNMFPKSVFNQKK